MWDDLVEDGIVAEAVGEDVHQVVQVCFKTVADVGCGELLQRFASPASRRYYGCPESYRL